MGARAAEVLRSLMGDVERATARCQEYGLPADVAAEGVRYATELMALALTLHGRDGDPDRPAFVEMIGPFLRWGWDNPYTTYHYAPLRGGATYRVFGQRNTSAYLGLTFYGGGDERSGAMPTSVVGSVNDTAIPVAPDGSYEITLSPEAAPEGHDGAWVTLDPDVSSVILRQYLTDVDRQTLATSHIERRPPAGPPAPLTDAELARRYRAARTFFAAMWGMSDLIVANFGHNGPNRFSPPLPGGFDPEGRPSGYMYPTPDNLYTFGAYELADDEALLVTVTPPACRYWSFYLGSVFQQSLPYDRGYGLVTRESAVLADDGSVTAVIGATDPGVPNWLGTQGHRRGMMALRWLLAETDAPPMPECTLVPASEVASELARRGAPTT